MAKNKHRRKKKWFRFRPLKFLWFGVTTASAVATAVNYKSMRRMAETMNQLSETLPKLEAAADLYLEQNQPEITVEFFEDNELNG